MVELRERRRSFRDLDIQAEARCDIIVSALAHIDDDGRCVVCCGGVDDIDLVACLWLLTSLYIRSWALVCVSYVGCKYNKVHIFLCIYCIA